MRILWLAVTIWDIAVDLFILWPDVFVNNFTVTAKSFSHSC